MSTQVHTLILGVDNTLDGQEDINLEKLQQEFDDGLGTVFAEIKDIDLKSPEEIAKMSAEEFLQELDNLERHYDEIAESLVKEQKRKEEKYKQVRRSYLEGRISDTQYSLAKLKEGSNLHDSYLSKLTWYKNRLAELDQ